MSGVVGRCPRPRHLQNGRTVRCKSRRCPSCGVLWATDTRKRILVNTEAYDGPVVLITITAPGSARLPDRRAMHRWNERAPEQWRSLWRAARQATARSCSTPTLLGWTWEYQRRGALHKHLVVGVKTAAELHAAHELAHQLARLRGRHDFGFVDRGRRVGSGRRMLEVIPAARAGRYLAKYLSPLDSAGKPTMSETVTREDVPPLVVYVSRALTSRTGCTMRSLRFRRQLWARGIDPDTGELLQADDGEGFRIYNDALVEALVRQHAPPPSRCTTEPARSPR